jgi:phosphatidate phosphatase
LITKPNVIFAEHLFLLDMPVLPCIYCTLFLSIYIQKRINLSKSVKTTFETALLALALHVVSTIVSDYWHHWSDVLAGVIFGAGSAVVVSINLY